MRFSGGWPFPLPVSERGFSLSPQKSGPDNPAEQSRHCFWPVGSAAEYAVTPAAPHWPVLRCRSDDKMRQPSYPAPQPAQPPEPAPPASDDSGPPSAGAPFPHLPPAKHAPAHASPRPESVSPSRWQPVSDFPQTVSYGLRPAPPPLLYHSADFLHAEAAL
ncbi:hypothetical protein BvCms2454_05030 [Escherichia coli]|nr:hypothetical protein BvCmsL27A_04952 [Escherichia coli]GCL90971.1 hypothetical protein BvCms2454_05030 [Escherichia coli]GDP82057.1 hypothetical protein BvCmsOUNP013_04581 [Escherichia coli]SQY41864.1 Uncharacterised protein [Escherichia coli]